MDRTVVTELYELSQAVAVIEDFEEIRVLLDRYENAEITRVELMRYLRILAEEKRLVSERLAN